MELTPLFEGSGSPIRKIRRAPTKDHHLPDNPNQSPGDSSNLPNRDPIPSSSSINITEEVSDAPTKDQDLHDNPNQSPGDTSNQPNKDPIPSSSSINITEEVSDSNNRPRTQTEESDVPRFSFGPFYVVGNRSMLATKEKAWEHVLNYTSTDKEVTMETYSTAISRVQTKAKETYDEEIPISDINFRWMMVKDGCLFLQLALLILGVPPDKLDYASTDPDFGVTVIKINVKTWIESMFFMGNQIPLVVLKELMSQKFFQDVIKKVTWDPSPSHLFKKVLYELLVLPAVKRPSWMGRLIAGTSANSVELINQSSDLLHGLENLVIGTERPGYLSNEYESLDDLDLEANDEEDFNICEGTVAGENGDRSRVLLDTVGLIPGDVAYQTRIFPSATDLKLAGIQVKKLKGGGIRRIHFQSFYFWSARLYLPPVSVDAHTEIIFKNLKVYEISQQPGKHKHHMCSYLKLMSGLIQTTNDVKLLQNAGIIDGSPAAKENLPRILSRLSLDVKTLTHEFHTLRRQIRDYSSPKVHYKSIFNAFFFVAALTVVQVIFAILAYFKPNKSSK